MKWYPADWRAETTLRMCRRAARSFWQDLLGLMHESHRYGYLLVNGVKPSVEQLARILGDSEREVRAWLAELETNGVYSKDENGVIYSRRMVRDYLKAQQDAENGKGGGNPKLRNKDNGGVNPQLKPTPPPWDKAQKPDAREQRLEESSSLRSDVSAEPTPTPAEIPAFLDRNAAFADAVAEWNQLAAELGLSQVEKLTSQRRAAWRARFINGHAEDWSRALAAIRASKFCRGENDREWRIDFDFLLAPAKLARLLEGKYADREGASPRSLKVDWEALRAKDTADAA